MGQDANDKLDRIEQAMLGTMENPGGFMAKINETNETVMILKSQFASMQSDVEALKTSKTKAIGIMIGASLASGGAGAAILKAFSGH